MIRLLTSSIRNKLLAITGIGTALVVLSALFGLMQAWQGLQGFDGLMKEEAQRARDVLHLRIAFDHQESEWKKALLRGDDHIALEKHLDTFHEQYAMVQKDIKGLLEKVQHPAARAALTEFAQRHAASADTYQKALELYEMMGYNGRMADEQMGTLADDLGALLTTATNSIMDWADTQTANAVASTRVALMQSLAIMGAAILTAFGLFLWLLQKSIVNPAKRLVADLGRLADGDFSHEIDDGADDELGQVAASAKQIQARLGRTLIQVADAVSQVAAAAKQMAVVSEQTNRGVGQQQTETEQVAAAMNQMSATVHEVARHAADAAGAARQADDKAVQGQKVVEQTVKVISALAADVEQATEVIRKLDEDSSAIGTVLDVIRGIAEQTNLLALNAAIEAARAGDQGRGFAVVADEVRTLALRTQQSTQEIQDMIERVQAGSAETVKVMDTGREKAHRAVDQAGSAGTALGAITQAVAQINDMNAQIASASEEQSAVTEEMNRSIANISQVSAQSAEGAQQTTRASEDLAKLAADLQQLTGQFKLRAGRVAK